MWRSAFMKDLALVVCLAIIAMMASRCALAEPGNAQVEGPRITDSEFFEMLDLDYPGLDKVKAAVSTGDMTVAKHEFAEYLRHRSKPVWPHWLTTFPRGKRTDKTDTIKADRTMQRDLLSVNVYHKYDGIIDWTLNPINYREWPWQLNRHWFWTDLGQAYLATGEEKYAQEFVYQMTDWVKQCPVPLVNGNNTETWRTIEAGIRMAQSWPPAYYMFLHSPSFTDEAIITMVKSCTEHARYLMRWPTVGNWLAMESNGLMHVGVLFPEFKEAADWRKTATDRLYEELDRQVYPDGAQIELSTGYHQVSLKNFARALDVALDNSIEMPTDYVAKMGKMIDYDLNIAMPDGYVPGLNDAGRASIAEWMKMGLYYFPERKDYEWIATAGKQGTVPAVGSIALPFCGHLIMRSGWNINDRYMLFDAGPFGYGHQHEDALSFVIYSYGKYMLIDPGNYPYDSSDWRKYVLSTRAHNTIRVDGLDQHRRQNERSAYVLSKPLPISWASDAKFDYALGTYEDGYGSESAIKVKHARNIFFAKPDYWIVIDTLTPSDDKLHHYESMFHLDMTGAEIDSSSKSVHTTATDGPNLSIIPMTDETLSVRVVSGKKEPTVQGWVQKGSEYDCRPIPTPIFYKEQAGTANMAYVFYPTPKGKKCPVVKVEPLDIRGAIGMAVHFTNGRIDYYVQAAKRGVKFLDFTSDGSVVYARTENGKVTSAMVADGTELTKGNEKIEADIMAISDLSRTTVRHKFETKR